jgi:hypothetical protein
MKSRKLRRRGEPSSCLHASASEYAAGGSIRTTDVPSGRTVRAVPSGIVAMASPLTTGAHSTPTRTCGRELQHLGLEASVGAAHRPHAAERVLGELAGRGKEALRTQVRELHGLEAREGACLAHQGCQTTTADHHLIDASERREHGHPVDDGGVEAASLQERNQPIGRCNGAIHEKLLVQRRKGWCHLVLGQERHADAQHAGLTSLNSPHAGQSGVPVGELRRA